MEAGGAKICTSFILEFNCGNLMTFDAAFSKLARKLPIGSDASPRTEEFVVTSEDG